MEAIKNEWVVIISKLPYIAGNFWGQNIRGSAILRHFVGNIFVVAACTAGKGRQGPSFVGKMFVVRPPTTNILPHENYTHYTVADYKKLVGVGHEVV